MKIINNVKLEEGQQKGRKMWFAFIPARELLKDGIIKVDKYDKENNPEGYQRELNRARAEAFAKFIAYGDKFSPASILLNIRNINNVKLEKDKISLTDDEYLWVVDGQHRLEGIKMLFGSGLEYEDMDIPVIMVNLKSKFEEAILFAVFNKTQTGVRYDLVEQILAEQIKRGNADVESLVNEYNKAGTKILKELQPHLKAIEVINILNDDKNSPWYNLIKFPNEQNKISEKKIIRLRSFSSSLEPLIDYFKRGSNPDAKTIAKHLMVFWDALKEIMPEAFNDPKSYVLQKSTGVTVLHTVYPKILIAAVGENTSIPKKEELVDGLKKIRDFLGDNDENFLFSEYWNAKNGKAGRSGTSKKSFKQLSEEIMASLDSYIQKAQNIK